MVLMEMRAHTSGCGMGSLDQIAEGVRTTLSEGMEEELNLFFNPVCLTMRLWVQDKQLSNFSQKEERGMGFPLSSF